MRLVTLQQEFQAYLLGRESMIGQNVRATSKASVATLLGVYRNAYWLRLIEVLGQNYPKLHTLFGDDKFGILARAYITAHPSASPNARWYGHQLPDFLRLTAPYSDRPILAECAAFEWALGVTFDAADADVLEASLMASLPPEHWGEARFTLHPSVATLVLRTNAVACWQAAKDQEALPLPEDTAPATWLIWRQDLQSYFRSLEDDEAMVLALAQEGAPFALWCERLALSRTEEGAAGRAAAILAQWFASGMISGMQVDQEDSP